MAAHCVLQMEYKASEAVNTLASSQRIQHGSSFATPLPQSITKKLLLDFQIQGV